MQKKRNCRQFRTAGVLPEWPVCGGPVLYRPRWCLGCWFDDDSRCMVKASRFPCERNRGSQVILHLQVFYDLPQKASLGRSVLWWSKMSSCFFATFAARDKSPLMISTLSEPWAIPASPRVLCQLKHQQGSPSDAEYLTFFTMSEVYPLKNSGYFMLGFIQNPELFLLPVILLKTIGKLFTIS